MLDYLDIGHSLDITKFIIMISALSSVTIWPFKRKSKNNTISNNPTTVVDEEIDYLDWGVRLGMLGKPDRALEKFQKAVDLHPESIAAEYNLALSLDKTEKYEEAKTHYINAYKKNPDSVDILNNLSVVLIKLGEAKGATEKLTQAIEIASDDAILFFNRGCSYMLTKDYDKASEDFRKAIRLDPEDIQAYYNLALTFLESGKEELASDGFKEFLKKADDENFEPQIEFAKKYINKKPEDKE